MSNIDDARAIQRFKAAIPEPLSFRNDEGYQYSWGHIIETRTHDCVQWDLCITELMMLYVQYGIHVSVLRRNMFTYLHAVAPDRVVDDPSSVGLVRGWSIIPSECSHIIRVITPLAEETAARCWITNPFITLCVPDVIAITHHSFENEPSGDEEAFDQWLSATNRLH